MSSNLITVVLQATPAPELVVASQALAVLANIIKIVEGVVIAFGAFHLWIGRKERREAEAKAAALARKAANYQAWQVINGAHGRGGSGGRIDALQDLVANDVSLAGVRLDGAWLERVALKGARLPQASLRQAKLHGAELAGANLERSDLREAQLEAASLRGAFLREADVAGATLGAADLSEADLRDLRGWEEIASISYANIEGIRHAPPGFRDWALANGAVEGEGAVSETVSSGFSTQWRSL